MCRAAHKLTGRSPFAVRPQIYELESVYFTADYTNFGNVVKASAAAGS